MKLLCCGLLLGIAVHGAELTFPAHPRFAIGNVATNAVIAKADELLKKGLEVPSQGGQWPFYYACPKDAAQLKPESLEKHICPVCKVVYTDERTVAAYRTLLHDQLNQQCYDLALAYRLTNDDKYAQPVRRALLELARLYPTLERHDRWGRTGLFAVVGGRRYCQHLEEGIGAIKLAEAYDLIANAPCFTDADRKTVEQDFLGATAREIRSLSAFAGGQNNHQTWFNATYTTVGVAIGDAELVNDGIHGSRGLLWQLENSVTIDGLWYEGTIAYHFYALQAIEKTLDSARAVGLDFADNKRLKSLWLGPAQLAYPNGQLPVFHDSDPANIERYTGFYKWAGDYFHDPQLLNLATQRQLQSADLPGIGVVALRRGAGTNAVCAMVDYGQHGGSHGHPDKLNLVLYALGREYVLDPGRITYSVPEYKTWCRTTVAHNTVVLDQQDQEATTGELWYFKDSEKFSAALCATDGAYPGNQLRRFLVLTDTMLVDVFTVTGKGKKEIDWLLHCRGTVTNDATFTAEKSLGSRNGYQHLTGVSRATGPANTGFAFRQTPGHSLRVQLAGDSRDALYQGTGIGYALNDKVPFLLRRHTGNSAVFVAVYSWTDDAPSVELLPVLLEGKALPETEALGLRLGGKTTALDLRKTSQGKTTCAGKAFERVAQVD